MSIVEAKVKKWGNSIGLVIPRDIVKIEDLHIGETIKIDITKGKRINAFGLFKGGLSFEKDEEEHGEFW